MPHNPHNIPGILKRRNPKQDLIHPNPFVFPFEVVSVITWDITYFRRLLTGIFGGFGIFSIYFLIIKYVFKKFQ